MVGARQSPEDGHAAKLTKWTFALATLALIGAHVYFMFRFGRLYVLFSALPSVFALSGIAFFLPARYRINALLLAIACVTSTYAIEFYLTAATWWAPKENRDRFVQAYAASSNGPYDPRSAPEVLHDHRSRGEDVWPAIAPAYFFAPPYGLRMQARPAASENNTVAPLSGGPALSRTLLCNETGQYVYYSSDEFGFNNRVGIWAQDPIDVAIVGDSFGLGSCVARERSIAGRVAAHFPRTLNLSVGGSGPLTELGRIKEFLPAKRPRIVLWLYYQNDISDALAEQANPFFLAYLNDGYTQHLKDAQAEVNTALRAFIEARAFDRLSVKPGQSARFSIYEFLVLRRLRSILGLTDSIHESLVHKLFFADMLGDIGATDLAGLSMLRSSLSTAQRAVAQWGGDIIFAYLPSSEEFCGAIQEFDRYCRPEYALHAARLRKRALAIADELGMRTINLYDRLATRDDRSHLFPWFGAHYSEAGHRLVAEALIEALEAGLR